jgi:thiol-disulfide isomerase/thioredoxin
MNMRKLMLLFTLNFCWVSISFADVVFINGDIKAAKARAAREGKLIFLDFWASYCTPCRMMEEYTFSDPSVSDFVRDNYIPVKVDIQSFDGYDLKNQYKISLLPTIIVLNSKGVQIGRHEETFTASRFIAVMKTYNNANNRIKIEKAGDSGYNTVTGYSNVSSSRNDNNSAYSAPAANNSTPSKTHKREISKPDPSVLPKNKEVSSIKKIVAKNELPNTFAAIFTVQVGAYSTKNDLNRAIEDVKKQFEGAQRMFVSERQEKGKWIYRILVGHFASRQQASSFLQSSGVTGFVRDLNSLKQ